MQCNYFYKPDLSHIEFVSCTAPGDVAVVVVVVVP